ncbi:siderophore iron transporter [Cryphonectria parasitica EP155]|uniref:Siderophore iron transporter n=1 Tax=Cryphonectria parasitica (strain ATCC 38755 / EP155) TaxID=660469 RepID=A0A9P4Y9M5_CRYP1|nr:siderophore iron transporter [Cryphonectria parasitica EP155]KAF3769046.1 siderophore iron transporter [Cryphonectria parasitica EP155]
MGFLHRNKRPQETETFQRVSLEQLDEKEIQAHPDQVTGEAAIGVQKAEAAAIVWPKWAVYCTYGWIWICFLLLALQQGMTTLFNYSAYADFTKSPELTTAAVVAAIIGGIIKLPIAKLLNLWGRAEAFMFFVGVYELGMIILAACNGPSSYAAGYVLYWIGYDALYLIMDVFVADTSGLRNRAFAFAFIGTPFICTAFTAPLAAQSYLNNSTWRWGYGSFCIIMFFVFTPLAVVFKFYTLKAQKMGLYKREPSGRTTAQSIAHYFHEFDIIGCAILMAAFLLFLLPFNLTSSKLASFSSAKFIAMVVIGILLFPVFYIWERYFARTHFVRWQLFRSRTVTGACCLAAILYFSFYCWDLYYQNFVLVVYDLDVSMAGYMGQIYNVGSTFWGVLFGIWVRYTKHFKYTALFFGLPLMFLGAGLMIHFRSADQGIGYLVMCQIFIAFAGGTLVISEDMAVMSAADRDGVPMMLSLISLSASIGGAIGYAVTGAIFDGSYSQTLQEYLPDEYKANATIIWNGGYTLQKTYPVGSDVRNAIDRAWGVYEKQCCIAATAVLVLAIPAIAVWKNYSVDRKQNKGVLI